MPDIYTNGAEFQGGHEAFKNVRGGFRDVGPDRGGHGGGVEGGSPEAGRSGEYFGHIAYMSVVARKPA